MKTILLVLAIFMGTHAFADNLAVLDLKLQMIRIERATLLEKENQLDIQLRDELYFNPEAAAELLTVTRDLELLKSQRAALVSSTPTISPPSLSQILDSLKQVTKGINKTSNAQLFNLITQAEIAIANGNQ